MSTTSNLDIDEGYDSIITGGGTVGCLVAGRPEKAGKDLHTLVLKAGPPTFNNPAESDLRTLCLHAFGRTERRLAYGAGTHRQPRGARGHSVRAEEFLQVVGALDPARGALSDVDTPEFHTMTT